MKILLVNLSGIFGDDELILSQLAYGLYKIGSDITICCLPDSQLAVKCTDNQIKVITVKPNILSSKIKLVKFFVKLIREKNFHIVHTSSKIDRSIISTVALAVKFIHLTWVHNLSAIAEKTFTKKLFYKPIDHVITSSETIKNTFISNNGINAVKVTCIDIGLNPEIFSYNEIKRRNTRAMFAFSDDHIIIGNIGNLSMYEGQKLLIEAFADVLPNYPRARVMIAGDGELKSELIRTANKVGVHQQVIFIGQRDDFSSIYSAYDIYIHTSLTGTNDVYPLSLVKALAYRLPIITTNVGDNSHFVKNGHNGFVLESFGTEELAQKLSLLLSQRTLQTKMGEYSYKLFKNSFDNGMMASKVNELYFRLAD